MKLNDETSMEPRLQEKIQECLEIIDDRRSKAIDVHDVRKYLDGILCAIHALTGEIWAAEKMTELNITVVSNEAGDERIIPPSLRL